MVRSRTGNVSLVDTQAIVTVLNRALCSRIDNHQRVFTVLDRRDIGGLRARLARYGIGFVAGICDPKAAISLARSLGEIHQHPDADQSGITRIHARVTPAGALDANGFTRKALLPHTDRSAIDNPPDYVFMVSVKRAPIGGYLILTDGEALFMRLRGSDPALLHSLCQPDAAVFSDGNHRHAGSVFERELNGDTCLRFRADNLAQFGCAIAGRLGVLMQYIEECTFRRELKSGEAVILNNHRWLHGRTAFSGNREIWRILIDRGPEMLQLQRIRGFTLKEDDICCPETAGLAHAA